MNRSNLKNYAPQARVDFIAAVTSRALLLGISETQVSPIEVRGDVAIIDGREWPAKIADQRTAVVERVKRQGFAQTMEEVAYTWFNRFAALRYMELHDYLDHGWRVLSSRDGGLPEILRHAGEVSLSGLDGRRVRDMQLLGSVDNELYKMLLVAQCNELSRAMPFLFEHIDDETELLLPENLLRTDSIVTRLVEAIPEEDWEQIEVIGWLYQYYISDKKDQVIGQVVKSEDIPAATQLFTPNWIVKYMVHNSLGRLWALANPTSTLKSGWEFFIEPADQTAEARAHLDARVRDRVELDGGSLSPETIKFLDPACGSGHILTEAYELLKQLYLERGYRARDIPRLILEKNLYGLDIDDRAAQLAAFALVMKARQDDRRLLNDPPRLNVFSLRQSTDLNFADVIRDLAPFGIERNDLSSIYSLFESAKTYGSLITIPDEIASRLQHLLSGLDRAFNSGDLYVRSSAAQILPYVQQALVLAMTFDAVVANPPYIGRKYMTESLKAYMRSEYPGLDGDLFAAFIDRNLRFAGRSGALGFMTPMVWMFISSHERLRARILEQATLTSLIQFEYNASGDVRVPLCIFSMLGGVVEDYQASFVRLVNFPGQDTQRVKTLEAINNPECGWFYTSKVSNFEKINGKPIAYWLGDEVFSILGKSPQINSVADARQGLSTGDTSRFVRYWFEVAIEEIAFGCETSADFERSGASWAPYNKGGEFRKYYGNLDYVVLWKNSGAALKDFTPKSVIRNESYFFKESLSWSDVTSSHTSFRHYPTGFVFDTVGHSAFFEDERARLAALGYLNSPLTQRIIPAINPTLHFSGGYFLGLPRLEKLENDEFAEKVRQCVRLSVDDAESSERSWNFRALPFVSKELRGVNLSQSWEAWAERSAQRIADLRGLERAINAEIASCYELHDPELREVPEAQITFQRADREKDSQRLLSYVVGCAMGRYSLDEDGLVHASAGPARFDADRYMTFPADSDGILAVQDEPWFEEDATNRVFDFLTRVWGRDNCDENAAWLAGALGRKNGETSEETIRRYMTTKFFKDHVQTYRKRPIYWLFTSGKEGAFQALVYAHRYTEGTLARMRSKYVIPLAAKMTERLESLAADLEAASATASRSKIQKRIETLRRKQAELFVFDEKLRHHADMRVKIELNDGVKANYAKFGDLVAESKLIVGASDE
ncbi:BREX-1 system adenine-specific DNA-methyltransferase PglX [Burkholderia metallica]|uniref:BREX-1 system adenine-specific DNA-methyltransferase PglX n=1 Tax=Burkholderia metallica TaxID=488729 RepID=UPI001CF22D0B|nr:BREX-1 system adenine-specific DNA-methyltransferase PglX [Burkholderia metallica]MCA8001352.1 BREX-1 system adenine-specific DNA-methyltransferase PglX [Burkholderia metallica]